MQQPSLFDFETDSDNGEDYSDTVKSAGEGGQTALSSAPPNLLPIRTLSVPPSASEFQTLHRNQRPVLFHHHDSQHQWPSLSSLLDGLQRAEAAARVGVLRSRDNRQFLKHELTTTSETSLAESLALICNPQDASLIYTRLYLSDSSCPERWWRSSDERVENAPTVAPILHDLQKLSGLKTAFKASNVGLWFSSAGCLTPLHFDLCHGFLHQLAGEKTFVLAAPEDTPYLYWQNDDTGSTKNRTTSQVDLPKWLEGDVDQRLRFPHVDNCTFYEARLSAGCTLYTPPGWWHFVVSNTASTSLLVPFDPDPDTDCQLPHNVLSV